MSSKTSDVGSWSFILSVLQFDQHWTWNRSSSGRWVKNQNPVGQIGKFCSDVLCKLVLCSPAETPGPCRAGSLAWRSVCSCLVFGKSIDISMVLRSKCYLEILDLTEFTSNRGSRHVLWIFEIDSFVKRWSSQAVSREFWSGILSKHLSSNCKYLV